MDAERNRRKREKEREKDRDIKQEKERQRRMNERLSNEKDKLWPRKKKKKERQFLSMTKEILMIIFKLLESWLKQ